MASKTATGSQRLVRAEDRWTLQLAVDWICFYLSDQVSFLWLAAVGFSLFPKSLLRKCGKICHVFLNKQFGSFLKSDTWAQEQLSQFREAGKWHRMTVGASWALLCEAPGCCGQRVKKCLCGSLWWALKWKYSGNRGGAGWALDSFLATRLYICSWSSRRTCAWVKSPLSMAINALGQISVNLKTDLFTERFC